MNIRLAVATDAEILSSLNADVQQLHADAWPHLFKQPSEGTFPPSAAKELIDEPYNRIYIGEIDGAAIGYIYAEIQVRPENPFTYERKQVLIHHISILPEHQKKGYGEQLIQSVKRLAREHDIQTIMLDVWSFNTKAKAFFERQGFTVFNQRMWLEADS